MFSFHKPKIYRSNLGCCICKAKSSSSRFTDSKKYENEFERCFRIQEKRSGEICNACVLLVKRWKKLSPENRLTKHWHHVVDARAGPGTKLTGNRRIVNHQAASGQNSSSRAQQQKSTNKTEVLPLTSSQANNQSSGSGRARTSSLSKARAIDTNVSTFTFGEPPSTYRRSYMSSEPAYSSLSPMSTSNSFAFSKPQSALNSSAFESVIKRFRQRQQQQHQEAQRRQQNREQKMVARQKQQQQQQQQQRQGIAKPRSGPNQSDSGDVSDPPSASSSTLSGHKETSKKSDNQSTELTLPSSAKRVKRSSESSSSSASYESMKVASVLEGSIWRKEKICCGVIFRGLYNEVAIFPRLLRPCECRIGKMNRKPEDEDEEEEEEEDQEEEEEEEEDEEESIGKTDQQHESQFKKDINERVSPPPRATKSGSISSSTSGTGSMEQPLEDGRAPKVLANRPRSVPSKRRRQSPRQNKDECGSGLSQASNLSSKGSASADSPSSATSSDNSSSMLLIDGEHMVRAEDDNDDDDDDDQLVMADDDALESSNDASSSADSLVGIEEGKNPVTLPCNIYN